MIFVCENFSLNTGTMELLANGAPQKIEPQVFAILSLLFTHHDRIVTKEEINKQVWGGRIVSDATVNSRIHAARLAIGDDGKSQRLIKTIPNIGFKFVGAVDIRESGTAPTPEPILSADKEKTLEVIEGHRKKPLILAGSIIALLALLTLSWTTLPGRNNSVPEVPQDSQNVIDPASVAVLAFRDMSENGDQRYFAEGMSEEILNVLAKNNSLKVTSRTSAFAITNQNLDIPEIAKALGVRHILEGSVRNSGDKVRVTVQLIDAITDTHLWSETYDRELSATEIFNIQDDIAREIVKSFSNYLVIPNQDSPLPTKSIEAYEAYLRGNELRHKDTQKSLELAAEQYRLAIQADPNFSKAYAGLAITYRIGHSLTGLSYEEVTEVMQKNIDKALELSPRSAEALTAAASLDLVKLNNVSALEFVKRAIEIDPNYSFAYQTKADAYLAMGEFENASKFYEKALLSDPISPKLLERATTAKIFVGDFENAQRLAKKNLNWNPQSVNALTALAYLELNMGQYERAHNLLRKAMSLSPKDKHASYDLFGLYYDLNMRDRAKTVALTPGLKAIEKVLSGEPKKALELIKLERDEFDMDHAAYLAGDFELAHEIGSREISEELLSNRHLLGHGQTEWIVEVCFLYKTLKKPEFERLESRLDDFFNSQNPDDTLLATDYIGAMGWRLLKDDSEGALNWLERAVDKGFILENLEQEPIFMPLKEHPKFKKSIKTMKSRGKIIRQVLTASEADL